MITPEQLGLILTEEFDKDNWGDIDPSWFNFTDSEEYSNSMRKVLQRVCDRVNQREVSS